MKVNNTITMDMLRVLQLTNEGGVSFETKRNKFRGSVNLFGQRFKTKYYPTKLGARRALNKLIRRVRERVISV